MKKLLCSALILFAPVAAAADFDPEFGMRMGYPYNDLMIDADLTKENGAASLEDPQMYLDYEGDGEYWGMPSVIAAPGAGVCGLGYYARPVSVLESDLLPVVQEILNSHLEVMNERYGNHMLNIDNAMTVVTPEAVVQELKEKGGFSLMAPAESRPDVMASVVEAKYAGGLLEVSGGLLYANITDCVMEIYDIEQ